MTQVSTIDTTSRIVFLNGEFKPIDQACVPVLDRGFIFGDAVYEVIPVYNGHLFRLTQHLARLHDSLSAIHLDNPHDEQGWEALLADLVVHNAAHDGSVYVQVTRGVAARDHAFPLDVPPTIFAMWTPKSPPPQSMYEDGVAALTREDIRWRHCHIKSTSLLANVLARQRANEDGCYEAILIRDGIVTEGAASNVFAVTAAGLVTPPKGPSLLPGITRDFVLELAHAHDITASEQALTEQELRAAAEIWLTSSTREIVPVTRLDGRPVGDGRPGPLWQRMYTLFQEFKTHYGATANIE